MEYQEIVGCLMKLGFLINIAMVWVPHYKVNFSLYQQISLEIGSDVLIFNWQETFMCLSDNLNNSLCSSDVE